MKSFICAMLFVLIECRVGTVNQPSSHGAEVSSGILRTSAFACTPRSLCRASCNVAGALETGWQPYIDPFVISNRLVEVCVDVSRFRFLAKQMLYSFFHKAKHIELRVAFVIQVRGPVRAANSGRHTVSYRLRVREATSSHLPSCCGFCYASCRPILPQKKNCQNVS